jgi:hypothetical protein
MFGRNRGAKEANAPPQEFTRNFVQVPPMPRRIPTPKAKRAQEDGREPPDNNSGVSTQSK